MRKGLGINRGKGYYNLVPQDHIVHSLSAKGVKQNYKQMLVNVANNDNIKGLTVGQRDMMLDLAKDLHATGHHYMREGTGIFKWLPEERIYQLQFYCHTEEEAKKELNRLNKKQLNAKFDMKSEIDGSNLNAKETLNWSYKLAVPHTYNQWNRISNTEKGGMFYVKGGYGVDKYFNEDLKEWVVKINREGMGVKQWNFKNELDAQIKLKNELQRPSLEFDEIYNPRHKLNAMGKPTVSLKTLSNGKVAMFDENTDEFLLGYSFNNKSEARDFAKKTGITVLNAQMTLQGTPVKETKQEMSSKQKVKPIGDFIVDTLKGIDPNVENVTLDDFGNYSGTIFVKLKSKKAEGNYILGDYDNFPDAKKFNLKQITGKIAKKLNKINKEKPITVRVASKPERQYQTIGRDLPKDFVGYTTDYIELDYEV